MYSALILTIGKVYTACLKIVQNIDPNEDFADVNGIIMELKPYINGFMLKSKPNSRMMRKRLNTMARTQMSYKPYTKSEIE